MAHLNDALHANAIASILEDARFVIRTANAMSRLSIEQSSPMSMALLPSFSLITYESRKWLQHHIPSVANQLPSGEVDRVATMRHAAKWLGASEKSMMGGIDAFRIMRAKHEERFFGNTPYRWARPLETDLGLYRHRRLDILNTHLIGVILQESAFEEIGPALRTASETMARQAVLLNSGVAAGPSFLDGLGRIDLRDVRSDKYYKKSGRADLTIAGYLHVLWCSLAFLQLLEPRDPDDEGPIVKLQFAGFYHVAQSLKLLEPSLFEGMGELGDGDVARRLRNAFVHYTPHSETSLTALNPARPRHELIQHAYGRDLSDFAQQLRREIEQLHKRLGKSLGFL